MPIDAGVSCAERTLMLSSNAEWKMPSERMPDVLQCRVQMPSGGMPDVLQCRVQMPSGGMSDVLQCRMIANAEPYFLDPNHS